LTVVDLELIRSLRGDGSLDTIFLWITNLGSELGYIVILSIVYLLAPRVGRQIGLWFGVTVALNTLFKFAFNLPRPYTLEANLSTPAAIATAGGPGLPSGHAQNAAFVWGTLAAYIGRTWLWIVAIVVTLLVAFSRLSLGVHFLEDVIVGLMLGAFMAWVATRVRIPNVNGVTALGVLIALAGLCALLPEDYGRALGVGWGFLSAGAAFTAPKNPASRTAFVFGGLILALGLYLASSRLLPDAIKDDPTANFLRYALLTIAITEFYPRVVLWFLSGGSGPRLVEKPVTP
jgi:membrane-associated phospholipid phosphatase